MSADAKNSSIVVDLERCTGCWTCAFSCKFGHGLPDDTWKIAVRTLGSGEGIDKPAGTWPNLHMEWMPVWLGSCLRCGARACSESYPEPYCVHNCPTHALSFGDPDDPDTPAGAAVASARAAERRIFKLPEYEGSREDVTYLNRRR